MANLRSFEDKARPSLVKQPNPKWKFGQGVAEVADGREWLEGEQAGWKYVDTATEDSGELYKLMLSGIVPRPVAFVSSESSTGIKNLAPFSWFNMVSNNPPVLSISASNVGASGKDTTNNIRATKQFVVNMISEPFIQQANATCIDTPEDVSEWPLSGLTQIDSTVVKPPRVKESVFSMECELFDIIDIKRPDTGESTTALILGLVKAVHVRKDVLNEKGRLDPAKYRPIARLGDISYTRVGDIFRVERPKWGDHAEEILALESKTGGRASL